MHNKCNAPESSGNHPCPPPPENLSSTKSVPAAKEVGDHCFRASQGSPDCEADFSTYKKGASLAWWFKPGHEPTFPISEQVRHEKTAENRTSNAGWLGCKLIAKTFARLQAHSHVSSSCTTSRKRLCPRAGAGHRSTVTSPCPLTAGSATPPKPRSSALSTPTLRICLVPPGSESNGCV